MSNHTLRFATETATIDPDGTGPLESLTRTIDRSRDNLQRPSGFVLGNEHAVGYGYDMSGRLATISAQGLPNLPGKAHAFEYTYEPGSSLIDKVNGPVHEVDNAYETHRNVLLQKKNTRTVGTPGELSIIGYTVNELGQRVQRNLSGEIRAEFYGGQSTDLYATNWGYDALGQVTSEDKPSTSADRGYSYDLIGNRLTSIADSTTTSYSSNEINQYTSILPLPVGEGGGEGSSVQPAYDQDGNMTTGLLSGSTTGQFEYDGANQLIRTQSTATSDPTKYAYDAFGRRFAKITYPNAGGAAIAATLFLYDRWNLIAEYKQNASAWTLELTHTWGLDLFGSLQGAGGVGGLLAVTRHEDQGATHFFATFDGNGNITEYLDAAGFIAAHYEYDPFGCTIVAAGPQAGSFEIRFSSKPQDEASGLHYYGYRWYDSNCGRWINSDPVAEAGGLNVYAFNRNDSLDGVDLLGMAKAKKSYNYHHWIPQEYAVLQFTGEGLCSDVSADLFTTRYPGNFSKNFPHYFIHFKIPFGDWVNDFKSVYSKSVLGLSGAIKAIPGLTDKQRCCLFLAGIEGLMITSNTLVHAVFKGLKDLPGPGMPPLESYPWSFPNGPDAPPVRILNKKTDEEWQALIAEKCCDMPDIDLEKLPVWVRHPRVSPQPTSPQFTNFNPVLLPPMCLPGATHWPSAPTTTIEDLQSLGIGVGVGVAVGTGVGVGVAVGAAVGSVGALGWGAVGGTLVWATQ